jgi:hypothetical protein
LPTDPRYSACFAVSSSYFHQNDFWPIGEFLKPKGRRGLQEKEAL